LARRNPPPTPPPQPAPQLPLTTTKQQQAVICISETKAALDGTPILKKVNRLMISNIDRIALIESMIFRQTNFKLKIYQVHTLIPGKRALGQNLN